jgi:hypothetical protein
MDVVALRVAAGGGSIDGIPAAALTAAGFTMLQRCVPLVRALAGRRAAILLAPSPAWLVALAAADGRGAVLLSPDASAAEIAKQCQAQRVGAVFTLRALSAHIPDEIPRVLLDDAPQRALFTVPGGDDVKIDLGSHFGLQVEGDANEPGRDEECVIIDGVVYTHRTLIHDAQHPAHATGGASELIKTVLAPLMAGAAITTRR